MPRKLTGTVNTVDKSNCNHSRDTLNPIPAFMKRIMLFALAAASVLTAATPKKPKLVQIAALRMSALELYALPKNS